jgi:hypothetical protein
VVHIQQKSSITSKAVSQEHITFNNIEREQKKLYSLRAAFDRWLHGYALMGQTQL